MLIIDIESIFYIYFTEKFICLLWEKSRITTHFIIKILKIFDIRYKSSINKITRLKHY